MSCSGVWYRVASPGSVQKGQGADLAEWKLLDPMLPTQADFMAPWTDRYDEERVRTGRRPISNEWLGIPANTIESIDDLGDGRVRIHRVNEMGDTSTVTVRSPSTTASRRELRRARAEDQAAGPTDEPLVHFGTYTDSITGEEVTFVADGSGSDRITYIPYADWSPQERKGSLDLRSREIQRTQKRMLSKVMDDLIRLADLRARFDWDERPAARLTYGGGTLFGALIAQLTLTIGGLNAFAVCDFCRTTWQPEQWPRGGPNDNTLCETHQNEADKAKLRRRVKHAGTLPVATKRRSTPNL